VVRSRFVLVAAAVAAALVSAPAASAGLPAVDEVDSGGFASENVQWVTTLPQHTGTSGGKLVDDHYYVTDPRGLFIYDVSKPEAPALVGELLAPQGGVGAALAQEDPDTNGKILLVNGYHPDGADGATANGWLLVVDVKDKTAPNVVGSLNLYDHTWTCILDCKYAIGRTGHIVDLRDPTKPAVVANWKEHVGVQGYMHDFEEVAPGRVIGAGQPSLYMDVRNPLEPKVLTSFDPKFKSLGYHGASWPNQAKDPLLLMGAEVAPSNAGSDCTDKGIHAVATYDATDVIKVDKKQFGPRGSDSAAIMRQRAQANFVKLEEWRVAGRGAYADGNAPAHTLYCGHWFDPHPDWKAGGVLALAHYDWGTRFLDVSRDGKMEQIGYFQPVAGHTASAEWISDEIVYVHDYRRGLDILRFSSK